ncbi:MAG: dihydroorotase [Gemmatimonadota bacterium]
MSGVRPLLLRGGRVVDPAHRVDGRLDVLLADGHVAAIGESLEAPEQALVLDVNGKVVTPGLIDVHVHLREPGGEHKETIESGLKAAAAGGFTAVCAMPNTDPPLDDASSIRFVLERGARVRGARVYPVGALSRGRKGERLTDVGELVDAGAVGITDDGDPIMDSGLMRLALEYAQTFGIPVADHAEDLGLSAGGHMNDGPTATRLGLKGKPGASEESHIYRDLLVAELTGGHIHLQHVSTRLGVEAIRMAKARGVHVTAEAAPHHLLLTEEAVGAYDTNAKMNPPLRRADDVAAVREGLRDGTLDVLATDHAPHHRDEKDRTFDEAPFGIVGLETAVGLVLTHVLGEGLLDLPTLVDRMSAQPARAFRLTGGSLAVGSVADVTVLDLEHEWVVDPKRFRSKSRNTPFGGWKLKGRAIATIVGGDAVWTLE